MTPDEVAARLRTYGYVVTGITFDCFEPDRGWGLLPDGHEVRFYFPAFGEPEVEVT